MKKEIAKKIESLNEEFLGYVKYLYENPELGNEEVKAMQLLANVLVKYGFETKYPNLLKTDFLGVYKAKKSGPKIGFLCEYDALPDIGHGCGHNMIGVMSILGAIGLKEVIEEIGGEIYVIGCPAEENFGGKVDLANKGLFSNLDACIMLHPGSRYGVGSRSSALIPVKYEFFGKSAHGCDPYNGASALDAAVSTYQGISMLRQFVKGTSFIHGIIKNGGSAANVVPKYSAMEYYFRATTIKYAREIEAKALNIAEAAAKMHGCEVKSSIYECIYEDTLINYTLADALKKEYLELGINEVDDVKEEAGGSTDVGACSYKCPTVQGNIKICSKDVLGHSIEFANCTISETGQKATILGAKVLANLAYELIVNKELLNKVNEEFIEQTSL